MATTFELTLAGKLAVAIQLMAARMCTTERDINRGIFLTPIGAPSFLETAEYQRLKRKASRQEEALARLTHALMRMAAA